VFRAFYLNKKYLVSTYLKKPEKLVIITAQKSILSWLEKTGETGETALFDILAA